MKMKTFQADNMQEALQIVKDEMGSEAVILKTAKKTRRSFGKVQEYVEVTAALEDSLYAKPSDINPGPTHASLYDRKGLVNKSNKELNDDTDGDSEAISPSSSIRKASFRSLDEKSPRSGSASNYKGSFLNQLEEIKGLVEMPTRELRGLKEDLKNMLARMNQIADSSHSSDALSLEFRSLFHELVEMELEEHFALELCQKVEKLLPISERDNHDKVHRFIQKVMANRLKCSGPIQYKRGRPTLVMLVGPTGVGKTTTIAKIAANARFKENKKVGIISGDCFRMGAREQLQIFGRASGIPVTDIFSPSDVDNALDGLRQMDLILIDTAGRSHMHQEMWDELQNLIPRVCPDEIHLVLSASTRSRELAHQYELYRSFGISSVVLTKLDECLSLGSLYNLACQKRLKFSYLCDGQKIPDNIMEASGERLADQILKQASLVAQEQHQKA